MGPCQLDFFIEGWHSSWGDPVPEVPKGPLCVVTLHLALQKVPREAAGALSFSACKSVGFTTGFLRSRPVCSVMIRVPLCHPSPA